MNRVALTWTEAEWFARNVLRMLSRLEERAKEDPKVFERTTYKLLSDLKPQAENAAAAVQAFGKEMYEIDVYLERKQKLLIREQITSASKLLSEKVVPTYGERGNIARVKLTKEKIKELDQMARKFK